MWRAALLLSQQRLDGVRRQAKADLRFAFCSQTPVKADRPFIPCRSLPLHLDATKGEREVGDFHHQETPKPQTADLLAEIQTQGVNPLIQTCI